MLAIAPAKPVEGDAVSIQLMDQLDPSCDIAAYVMPKRETDRSSLIYVEASDPSEPCRIAAAPASSVTRGGANARAPSIALGALPAGRYSVQVGSSRLDFEVRPGAKRPAAVTAP